jgi:hypothetical protein
MKLTAAKFIWLANPDNFINPVKHFQHVLKLRENLPYHTDYSPFHTLRNMSLQAGGFNPLNHSSDFLIA